MSMLAGRVILVVDSESGIAGAISEQLRHRRAHVRVVRLGDAVRSIRQAPVLFDAIVLDVPRPASDLVALVEWLRKLPPEAGGQIACVVTGQLDAQTCQGLEKRGCVVGPPSPEAVVDVVGRAVAVPR